MTSYRYGFHRCFKLQLSIYLYLAKITIVAGNGVIVLNTIIAIINATVLDTHYRSWPPRLLVLLLLPGLPASSFYLPLPLPSLSPK